MLIYPNFDPVAVSLGPIKVHWYGIMYVIGFAIAWALGNIRALQTNSGWTSAQVSDLIFFCVIGVIAGGRLGYVLFYDTASLIQDPLYLLRIWQPGMSFHGGLIGVMCSIAWFCYKTKKTFLQVADFTVPIVPLGLGAGRIGNFINGELWGRATDLPWGMVFRHIDNQPRHPSQLYEFLFEGIILFVILWLYSGQPRRRGAVTGLFLLCYGVIRFVLEFAREPDAHLGFIAFNWLTMGQLLSLPMIGAGLYLLKLASDRKTAIRTK